MKRSLTTIVSLLASKSRAIHTILPMNKMSLLNSPVRYQFCTKPPISPLKPTDVPSENLKIVHEEAVVGEEKIESFKTKGAISILDNIKGTRKTDSGELYVLMFTCNKCNTRAIRSFTKNAYHNGVVLIRCQGCRNVHLVADNLQWFGEKRNLQNMGEGKVEKVHDPVAITRFIKAAFGDEAPKKPNQGQGNKKMEASISNKEADQESKQGKKQ